MCNNICVYEVRFAASVVGDLKKLRAAERRRILDEVQKKLSQQPTRLTKQIKQLRKLVPPFEAVPPIWQLRVGDYRVFYDVDRETKATSPDDGGHPMKTITVRDLQKSIKEAVESAQRERVVVTRHGKPAAVLLGVEGRDWETVVLETSSELWKLIEERRAEPTLSAEELERKLGAK
jgi:prevent-host-death family protein